METTEELSLQLQQARERAEAAERRLEVAKKELLKLSTDTTPEELARSRATIKQLTESHERLQQENASLTERLGDLAQQVQRFRTSYLSGELDNSILRERLVDVEERLTTVVQPLPADDQRLVRERRLSWMALQDPLTKLANSNRLDLRLEEVLEQARQREDMVVLMLLDVDHFHTVNEVGGWRAGNALLSEIAQRLTKLVQGSDTFLARRGEDEFGIIFSLPRPETNQMFETPLVRVRQLADLILQVFEAPFELAGQRLPITATLGLSVFPNDADTGQEMLENAHVALGSAKRHRRGSYLFFNDKLYLEREDRAGLATELSKVIEEGRLLFLYRPVVSIARGSLAMAQIEAYWDHPVHGRVGQSAFLPIAENLGLAPRIAEQALQAALTLSRKVKGSIPAMVRLPSSVLGRADLVKSILDQVSKAHARPESLVVDLSVESFERWPREATSFLEEMGRWRVGRSLSDVGAGPVPLRELQTVRPDMVGLAPEITMQVPQIESHTALLKGLLQLFQGLGLATRAEGVKDQTQAHFLALHEGAFASGDYLAPALGLEDFLARRRATWTLR